MLRRRHAHTLILTTLLILAPAPKALGQILAADPIVRVANTQTTELPLNSRLGYVKDLNGPPLGPLI